MPEFDVMITLTDDELDAVTGGQTVSLSWSASGTGSGPTNVTITSEATGSASVVGGLAPSASGSLSGTFTVDAA
jgi:bacteriocin-like protein